MGNARIKRDGGKQGNGDARDAAPKVVLVGTYRGDQLVRWRGWYCWPMAADAAMQNAECRMQNTGNGRVLAKPILVSAGHEDGTAQIDIGAVFREALKAGAEEIVVAHNHPSGDLTPSKADLDATSKLRMAGDLLSVPLLDHIILGHMAAGNGGPPAFTSLAESLPNFNT